MGCGDIAPHLSPVAIQMFALYGLVSRRCRNKMAGGFDIKYAQETLENKYGESIYTEKLLDSLSTIENYESDFHQRSRKK